MQLKQAQTAQPLIFLLVDSTDHITGKTGLSPTVTLSKSGGAFASPAGAVSEIGSGWYKVAGNATDTGTLGPLLLHASAAGADPVDVVFEIVAYDPQSATNLGLSDITAIKGYTDTVETVLGTIQTAIATLQATADAIDDEDGTIQTAIATLQTSADTIAGYTDTLEASATSISGKADTIITQTDSLEGSASTLATAVGNIPSPPTVDEIAAAILVTPAHKLVTDVDGNAAVDAAAIAAGIDVSGLTDNQASQLSTIYANVQGGSITVTERVTSGNTIIVYRGERLIIPLTAIGDVSDGRQVWFTVKGEPNSETDEQSIIQIKRNGGLVVFQGNSEGLLSSDGYIEFDDEEVGTGRIVLKEAKTQLLTKADATYDVQVLDPDAGPVTRATGKVRLSKDSDVTRAIG